MYVGERTPGLFDTKSSCRDINGKTMKVISFSNGVHQTEHYPKRNDTFATEHTAMDTRCCCLGVGDVKKDGANFDYCVGCSTCTSIYTEVWCLLRVREVGGSIRRCIKWH